MLLFSGAYAFSTAPMLAGAGRASAVRSHALSGLRMESSEAGTLSSRRNALMTFAGLALGAAVAPKPAAAAEEVELYVGAGCFWHVQHEVTEAERKILGRSPAQYTAVAGYAGGTKVGNQGKVCYHNLLMDSDYGRLGHTEVVSIKTPVDKVPEIANLLIPRLFVKGIRADPQDRGGEYRSALGLPGGMASPLAQYFAAAAETKGMRLVDGKGDEGDTIRDRSILVYDTKTFPFYAGEVYHQYHDDMVEKYGSEYGALRGAAVQRGALKTSGCPEIGF